MSTSTPKATWTPALHKTFIDLCLEEILKGNKYGSCFTKEGWRNIVGSFYAKTGVIYDRKQVKNHYDATRRQWKAWVKLIGDSRMNWDPVNNKFGASVEDWHNYIKAHPEATLFQFKEIQFPDKLDIIFDGGTQAGEMKTSTSLKRQNDTSAASPLRGKEREKKHKNVSGDCELDSAVIINATPINKIASEQSMSSYSRPKIKATWAPPVHKIFVNVCLQETLKGNKPGTRFTKEGWKNIVESFHSQSGLKYDRLQLKNHWDATREQWKIWCKLIDTSYMKWDPCNQRFGASEEDWTNYLQANPEAAPFRFKELQFAEILETIFNGTTVTGETEPAAELRKNDDSIITSSWPSKEPDAANLDKKTVCLCDVVESRNGVINHKNAIPISSTTGKLYSIGECIECLDSTEEIEQGSELYLFALDVFLKREYREIFLQLKKPNLRISWLQRLQSVGPPSL